MTYTCLGKKKGAPQQIPLPPDPQRPPEDQSETEDKGKEEREEGGTTDGLRSPTADTGSPSSKKRGTSGTSVDAGDRLIETLPLGIAATTVACPPGNCVVVFNPTRGDATVQSGTQAVLLKPGEGASISDFSDATPIVFTALATGIPFALFPRKSGGHETAPPSAGAESRAVAAPAPKIGLLDAAAVRDMQNVPALTQSGLSSAVSGASSAGMAAGRAASAGAATGATKTAAPVLREIVKGTMGVSSDSFGLYGTAASSSTAPMTARGANLQNCDIRLCATYKDGRKIAYYANEFVRVAGQNGETAERAIVFAGIENKAEIKEAAVQAVDGAGRVISEIPVNPLDASISVSMPETAPPGSTIPARIDYVNYLKCAKEECYQFDLANYELQLAAEPADLEHPRTALLNATGQTQVPVRIPTTVLGARRWTFSAILAPRSAETKADPSRGRETTNEADKNPLLK